MEPGANTTDQRKLPAPVGLVRGALVFGLLAGLAGCRSPEARFSTIADLPEDLRGTVLLEPAGVDPDGTMRVRVAVDQRLVTGLPERAVLIPFTDERPWAREGERGRPVVEARVWPVSGWEPTVVRAVVDTGAGSTLIVSRDMARRMDVWLSAEIGPHDGIGFVGPVSSGEGLVRRLEIGPVALAPAEVKVNTQQEGRSAALGLSAFLMFGGIVFDWEQRVIVALPRGRAVRIDPGWSEVSWAPMPTTQIVALDGDGERPGATPTWMERGVLEGATGGDLGVWRVRSEFRGIPTVQAAVAGRSLRVVLDTGGDGELASLRSLLVEGAGRPRTVASHGRVQRMREHTLSGPVRIGTVRFESPTVVVPDPDRVGDEADGEASLQFFDAVVGVELLRRQAVWFDFERGVVRLWTGSGPMPALLESRVTDVEGRS